MWPLVMQKGRSRMARGKRAAALFEVIQAAKQKEQLRAQGGGFLTPSWWFKGNARTNGTETAAPPAPPPATRAEAPPRRTLPAKPAPIVPEIAEPEPTPEPVGIISRP